LKNKKQERGGRFDIENNVRSEKIEDRSMIKIGG